MEETAYLYQILNTVNGKRYLGVTKNPESRRNDHMVSSSSGSKLVKDAVSKYGSEAFEFSILFTGNRDLVLKEERKMVFELNTIAPFGYNLVEGGGDPPRPTPGCRKKVRVTSEETKRKLSISCKGVKKKPHIRKPMSSETKLEISEAKKAKALSREAKGKGVV